MDGFDPRMAAQRFAAMEAAKGAPGVPGMAGTPGGPVQESPTMEDMRALQRLMALGLVGTGTASMFGAAGPLGVASGQAQMAGGAHLAANSMEPNIRDVHADQLRMKLQGN